MECGKQWLAGQNQEAKLFALGNQLRTWHTYIYIRKYIHILAAVPVNTLHFLLFYHLSGFLCYFCARLVADLTWVQTVRQTEGASSFIMRTTNRNQQCDLIKI